MAVNILAVLVSAVLAMISGFIWYGPIFGKKWMKLVGMTERSMDNAKSNMSRTYIISFASAMVMAYVLVHFIKFSLADSFVTGMSVGFWSWLGFVATTSLTGYLYSEKPKPSELYFIDNGYQLLTLMLMGGLLAVWQ
ncbi:hypothetical protein A3D05_02870 [Candidatus Gottesmanbacteria bacterium RIFCSPHIGHO2_02_FULL_40_24]|uniref:DUF1761 domain-containing protein n=1 Tax=Candidatus Gottesmanbacteria bacterium RIFCSPHIGHO2_01_FULL_40_15 TaxID=1798376 RepID=A0A1F5Z1G7_9BACT|nr:MAG: hypothetical protein A2777_00735 [Candidatus Gottesmanbacteria bacterium RIFCSPHIGHO2_01_FULL_40_15]OGG17449.1 MAG: hypothetical protein A3D05_02870 [Candidatus Gottesmanbacteria bacterium RIFCSPHIGHO2_02_FULL_40_24]OGG25102.1 MAG: hypothetical protein A3E42_00860 [Candidatus Gottesmanbacteria bacterium RIFCSPHIGHO2_12_FULL_40_13]OGG32776.1 MAG: hypothetical protein A3I80_00460 [Candidatus Gottesmanbacteria bacterium RIFCSPLOWO2_02_FULL_40_10]